MRAAVILRGLRPSIADVSYEPHPSASMGCESRSFSTRARSSTAGTAMRRALRSKAVVKTRDFDGDSPAAFVLSQNVRRRHLTAGQRAAVAVDFLPALEAEAKARMAVAGSRAAPTRPATKPGPTGPTLLNLKSPIRGGPESIWRVCRW